MSRRERQHHKGMKRPRAWHRGRGTGKAYRYAVMRLDRAVLRAERRRVEEDDDHDRA